MTREQVVTYAISDEVAPQHPHRSRIVLPLREGDAQLDALMVHELTHLLVGEIILPQAPGDGGVPRWVQEGIASYMAGGWSDDARASDARPRRRGQRPGAVATRPAAADSRTRA